MTLPVTTASLPQCCEVCRDSERPGLMQATVLGSDEDHLIPCPHCAGAFWLEQLLKGNTMSKVRSVVICGSLKRAGAEILQAAQEEWKKGHVVYAPVSQPDIPAEEHDRRHRAQILAADEVVIVIGRDGRIGESTASERRFAQDHGKPVRYFRPVDEVA